MSPRHQCDLAAQGESVTLRSNRQHTSIQLCMCHFGLPSQCSVVIVMCAALLADHLCRHQTRMSMVGPLARPRGRWGSRTMYAAEIALSTVISTSATPLHGPVFLLLSLEA